MVLATCNATFLTCSQCHSAVECWWCPMEAQIWWGFPGQLVPCGAKILFWNNPKRADNSSGKMSPTANDCVFLGYHIQPGFAWKGEYLVAKLEASDYHAENGSTTGHATPKTCRAQSSQEDSSSHSVHCRRPKSPSRIVNPISIRVANGWTNWTKWRSNWQINGGST